MTTQGIALHHAITQYGKDHKAFGLPGDGLLHEEVQSCNVVFLGAKKAIGVIAYLYVLHSLKAGAQYAEAKKLSSTTDSACSMLAPLVKALQELVDNGPPTEGPTAKKKRIA